MDFKGKYTIPASPEVVWAALHEPEMLAAAIPGCEGVEKLSDTEFKARATIKVGPVKARFEGKVQLEELPPPSGVVYAMALKGEGQGGAAGFARGESQVRLSVDGAGTLLEYDAKATIGGRLAQVGQRLIDGAAKAIADEFFAKFAILMQAQAVSNIQPKPVPQPRERSATSEEGLAPQIWVVGLIGIVIILLIVFSIVL
jgi:carbon monoxide dehydrogenase subunit G